MATEVEFRDGVGIAQRQRQLASWSAERLMALFISPLYLGHQPKRRHKPGRNLTRDSLRWTPLIEATMGMRPWEVLQLPESVIFRRKGICASLVAEDAGTTVKDRGRPPPPASAGGPAEARFIGWVNAKRREDGMFLFDDIEPGAASDRLSGVFGGRLTSIRKGLGIVDEGADFCALSLTVN